jgi:hypothetical protein
MGRGGLLPSLRQLPLPMNSAKTSPISVNHDEKSVARWFGARDGRVSCF